MHNRWDFILSVWREAGGGRCSMSFFKRKWVIQLLYHNKPHQTLSEKAFHFLPTESAIHAIAKHQLYLGWLSCLSSRQPLIAASQFFLSRTRMPLNHFLTFFLFLSTLLRIFLTHYSLLFSQGWTDSMPVSFLSWECYLSSSIHMYLSYPDIWTHQMLFVEQGGRKR